MADKLKKNAEGYVDPTAYAAIKNIIQDENAAKKAAFLISVLKFVIRESGFEPINRIEIKDRQTGRVFR